MRRQSTELAFQRPAYGQLRASNELKKKGIFVSPGGVRSVWLRHDLETFTKRLKALEARVPQDSLILTEDQLRALEKAKTEKEAHGDMRVFIQVISAPRTPITSARSRASGVSTSRPSSIPTPR